MSFVLSPLKKRDELFLKVKIIVSNCREGLKVLQQFQILLKFQLNPDKK